MTLKSSFHTRWFFDWKISIQREINASNSVRIFLYRMSHGNNDNNRLFVFITFVNYNRVSSPIHVRKAVAFIWYQRETFLHNTRLQNTSCTSFVWHDHGSRGIELNMNYQYPLVSREMQQKENLNNSSIEKRWQFPLGTNLR